eukprot:15344204-Ditylum_brightwellii.AAC.1
MGTSALKVNVVWYYSYQHKYSEYTKAKSVGAFEVIGSAWDSTLDGLTFDNLLVDYMADESNEMWNAKHNNEQKWLAKKNHDTTTEPSQTMTKAKETEVEGLWFWNDTEQIQLAKKAHKTTQPSQTMLGYV